MSDIFCIKCGEPWDSYGITYAKGEGDLTRQEVEKFLHGEGCPSCGFGTTCTKCDGAGIERNECPTCFGKGYLFARKCPTAQDSRFQTWFIGYSNSPNFPIRVLAGVEVIKDEPCEESSEGQVFVARIKCPDCHCKGDPCSQCGGDGKFHQASEGEHTDRAVNSLLDASDGEPIDVLSNFLGV